MYVDDMIYHMRFEASLLNQICRYVCRYAELICGGLFNRSGKIQGHNSIIIYSGMFKNSHTQCS